MSGRGQIYFFRVGADALIGPFGGTGPSWFDLKGKGVRPVLEPSSFLNLQSLHDLIFFAIFLTLSMMSWISMVIRRRSLMTILPLMIDVDTSDPVAA